LRNGRQCRAEDKRSCEQGSRVAQHPTASQENRHGDKHANAAVFARHLQADRLRLLSEAFGITSELAGFAVTLFVGCALLICASGSGLLLGILLPKRWVARNQSSQPLPTTGIH
jgi:hypothetical protein